MNNINKLLNYLYIFTGFFITIYIMYIRMFLIRIPKDLYINFCADNYNIKLIFLIVSIIICIYIIITNIKIELNMPIIENKITKILEKISTIITKSLKEFYGFILSFYENNYNFISNISKNFYGKFSPYPEYYLLFTVYFIRLIILTIFLFEIFYKFKLDYFYKSLILLSIVLFIKFLIFILRDFAGNLETFNDALIIENEFDEKTQLENFTYKLKTDYQDNELAYVVEEFKICNKLSGYLNMYDRYNNFFNTKFNIIIYSLYFIGWFYILIINIL